MRHTFSINSARWRPVAAGHDRDSDVPRVGSQGQSKLSYILAPPFFIYVLLGGITVVALVVIRAITLWQQAKEVRATRVLTITITATTMITGMLTTIIITMTTIIITATSITTTTITRTLMPTSTITAGLRLAMPS